MLAGRNSTVAIENDHARKLVRVEITIGPRSLENIGAFEVAAKGSDGDGSDHVGCLTGGRERHNVDVQTVPGKACGWRVSCSLAAGGMLSTELTAVPRDRAGYRPAHSRIAWVIADHRRKTRGGVD